MFVGLDSNTTNVVQAAIVLAFVVAVMRRFDRVSLRMALLQSFRAEPAIVLSR